MTMHNSTFIGLNGSQVSSWIHFPYFLKPMSQIGTYNQCSVSLGHIADENLPYYCIYWMLNGLNFVSNLIAYCIFQRHHSPSTNPTQIIIITMLKALSVLEILFQIFILFYYLMDYLLLKRRLYFTAVSCGLFLCFLQNSFIVLQTLFHVSRNWMVVAISSFRYEAVCRAMHPWKLFTNRSVFAVISVIIAVAFIISIPRFFVYTCVFCPTNDNSGFYFSSWEIRLSQSSYKYFNLFYNLISLLIFQSLGPIVFVCLFSSCIMSGLRRRTLLNKSLRGTKNSQRDASINNGTTTGHGTSNSVVSEANRANLLVIILCSVFFVLELPAFISKAVADRIDTSIDKVIARLALTATLIDSLANIFIYSVSNPWFRDDLRRILLCGQTSFRRQQYLPATSEIPLDTV